MATRITFANGKPDSFYDDLIRHGEVDGWFPEADGLVMLTDQTHAMRGWRLPEGVVDAIKRANGSIELVAAPR